MKVKATGKVKEKLYLFKIKYFFSVPSRGRKAIVQQYPEIVAIAETFISQNGTGAHLRRRSDTHYINGVSLEDIRKHVTRVMKKSSPSFSISRDTIHRLLLPPTKRNRNSARYRGLINARKPPKRNTAEKKTHKDHHFASAQVNYNNQLFWLHEENSLVLSVDNKNKIIVDNAATHRKDYINKFYLENDAPNNYDHDYPHPNTKLNPEGYYNLSRKRSRSRSVW